jgi:hypothetical protein
MAKAWATRAAADITIRLNSWRKFCSTASKSVERLGGAKMSQRRYKLMDLEWSIIVLFLIDAAHDRRFRQALAIHDWCGGTPMQG